MNDMVSVEWVGRSRQAVRQADQSRSAIAARYDATLAFILNETKAGAKGTTELTELAVRAGVLDKKQAPCLMTYISKWKREGRLPAGRIIRGGRKQDDHWPKVLEFVKAEAKKGSLRIARLLDLAVQEDLLTPAQAPQLRNKIRKWKRQGKLKGKFVNASVSPILERLRADLITDITDKLTKEGRKTSVRGVWYRCIAGGHIDKDPASPGYYSAKNFNVVFNELREAGRISFNAVEDATRQIIEPMTFKGVRDRLLTAASWHTLNIWQGLRRRVIVLEEKHGLEGAFRQVTDRLQVPLLATGGYNSRTMAHEICKLVLRYGVETHVLMFGDHDADGEYAHEKIEDYTRKHFVKHFGGDPNKIKFEHVSVTREQIQELGLITREPNRKSKRWDWWSEKFGENEPCCEIDAIEPDDLEAIIEKAIFKFGKITKAHIARVEAKEAEQRREIEELADQFEDEGGDEAADDDDI